MKTVQDIRDERADKTWTQIAETMRQQASSKPASTDDEARAVAMQAMMEKAASGGMIKPVEPSRLRLRRLRMAGVQNPEQVTQALAGKV